MPVRSVVVALLAGALCARAGEAARSCAADPDAADDGGCAEVSSASMMQLSSPRSTAEARSGGGSSSASSCRKLAIFFDGTKGELNKTCEVWHQGMPGTCETIIAKLWRLAGEVDEAQQLSHYEPGVAWSGAPNDDGCFGVGTKQHMLNAYKWLTENYEPCGNQIYVFGYSRGTLQARMLQGMIHRIGLARPGNWKQAAKMHFDATRPSSDVAAYKSSDLVWQGVKIEHIGMFDAVLRTLLNPVIHSDIASYHMQMTSSVLRLAHAIALDEHREIFEAAELYTDPATNAAQVWFLGEHSDVGGGGMRTGITSIGGGWVADQAEAAGFLLPVGWRSRSEMEVNYLGDTMPGLWPSGAFRGLQFELIQGLGLIRNPVRCRESRDHPFRGQRVLFHQSVADRMQGNPGWVPLSFCCSDFSADLQSVVSYVTSEHYEARKAGSLAGAPWLKLTFGWLRDAHPDPSYETEWGSPEYYVKATSWTDEVPLPAGGVGEYEGCCTVVTKHPAKGGEAELSEGDCPWWSPCPRATQDFRGTTLVLPRTAVANKIIVEVHEDDTVWDDFVGRVEIQLSDGTIGQMKPYPLASGGTIDIMVESIPTDAAAKDLLPGAGDAQCRWLQFQTGMSFESLCHPTSMLMGTTNLASANTCDGWIVDIKTGAF